MRDGVEWLLRPCKAGMCLYESLKEPGKLDLVDIALMNEYLDACAQNEQLAIDANT